MPATLWREFGRRSFEVVNILADHLGKNRAPGFIVRD